tara:strand:+ start:455 stop:739 length:285 start_codon:yes stop_codon:yes gene_type:complete
MISTTHHLQATIKRALKVQSDEKVNDIELDITIKNIDESVFKSYCKENGIAIPKYTHINGVYKYLYVNNYVEGTLVGFMAVSVPITNPDEYHTN